MAMVGHRTESVYRRYATSVLSALCDAANRLDLAAGTISGHNDRNGSRSTAERVIYSGKLVARDGIEPPTP